MHIRQRTLSTIQFTCLTFLVTLSSTECYKEHPYEHLRHLQSSPDDNRFSTPDPGEEGEIAIENAVKAYREKQVYEISSLPLVVPVCFHTLYPTGGAPLTDEKLQNALDHLNKAFTSSSCCDPALEWCTSTIVDNLCSTETQITFEMAELVGGIVTGDTTVGKLVNAANACVTRTQNSNWFNHSIGIDYEPMTEALYKGDLRVLNVYFVQLMYPMRGFSTYPFMESGKQDGVIMGIDNLPGNTGPFGEGDSLVHEVGHWFGLLNVYAYRYPYYCDASDGILDTPKTRVPNYGCDPMNRPDTCSTEDGLDPIFNFMDASDDVCRYEFTAGQKEAMLAMWEFYRSGLGNVSPDIIELQLGVPSDPINFYLGSTLLFKLPTDSCDISCRAEHEEDKSDVTMYMEINREPRFDSRDSCVSNSLSPRQFCSFSASLVNCGIQKKCSNRTIKALYIGLKAYTSGRNLYVVCKENLY